MPSVSANYDLDMFMDETGHCGRYEILTFSLIGICIIYTSFASFSFSFTAEEIKRRCIIPECEVKNNTEFDAPHKAYTSDMNPAEPCKRYNITFSAKGYQPEANSTCPANWFNKHKKIDCNKDDLIYMYDDITIMHDFNMQCNGSNLLSVVGSLSNVGQAFGFPTLGYFSDRYGRKPILIISTLCTMICGTIHMFNKQYIDFVVVEIIMGFFITGTYNSAYVLGVELVGRKCRVLGGVIISTFYSIGLALLGTLAMYIRNWKNYSYIHPPFLVCIIYIWLLPESPRWLNIKGKEKKLKKELMLMGKCKGHKYTEDDIMKFKITEEHTPEERPETEREETEAESTGEATDDIASTTQVADESEPIPPPKKRSKFKRLLKSRILMLRLVNCYFCWITNSLVYVGLQLAAVDSVGDRHMNFIFGGLIEIPAYAVTPFLANYFGRRNSICVSLIICGICNTVYPFYSKVTGGTVAYFTAKLAITVSYAVVYIFTAELFPTVMRHSLLGSCSMIARIGAITAPLWNEFNKILYGLPFFIFAITCTMSGILLFLMPETLHLKLPDTIEEAEQIRRRRHRSVSE